MLTKYDRQLRLWGAAGQEALTAAHVLLLGAGPTGTETLKNLVLPGIGCFTIVDGETVVDRDVNNNFFVRAKDVGRPRATVSAFVDRQPEVQGFHRVLQPRELVTSARALLLNRKPQVDKEPSYILQFALVIAAQLDDPSLVQSLGELCWESKIPLLVCRSYGLAALMRLQIEDHEVIESKSEFSVWDLRIGEPFEGLCELADSVDLSHVSDVDHAHIPYVVLLTLFTKQWRRVHQGHLPATAQEKATFRRIILSAKRCDGEFNFDEAVEQVFQTWADPRQLPPEVTQAIDAAASSRVKSSPFKLCLQAIGAWSREDNDGKPPLSGTIPDMHASTDRFVALQRVYDNQAEADCNAVQGKLRSIATSQLEFDKCVSGELLTRICKHLREVRIVTTKSLAEEMIRPYLEDEFILLESEACHSPQNPFTWYIAVRAADRFFIKRRRWPHCAADASNLSTEVCGIHSACEPVRSANESQAGEIVRFCHSELHSVASIIGGVASQEAVKVLTKQCTPLNHTFVFDGISATSSVVSV